MWKKLSLGVLLLVFAAALFEYLSAPVFWQRFVNSLLTTGSGADSPVFDNRETVAASPQPQALPQGPALADTARGELIDYANNFDSFSLLVLHRGKIVLEWYRQDYHPQRLTQSQSMHKTLQAILIGQAIEQGLINSVDQPAADFLPEWQQDSRRDITIRQLLQMSSGLENFTNSFNPWAPAFRWLFASDTISATLAFPQQQAAAQQFDYNDLNAQLLGIILSRASGRRYSEWLAEQLWQPLGNGRAEVWLDRPGGEAMHACCLLATTRDWARFGLMLANQGRNQQGQQVVPAAWIEEMVTASPLTPHYGYLIWLGDNQVNDRLTGYRKTEPWLVDDVAFLSGYGAQRVYVSPSAELVVVRTGPASGYFPKIIQQWDDSFLVNRVIRALNEGK